MSQQHTYAEIANNFSLWSEFVDPDGNMSEEEFNSIGTDKKIKIQVDAFGPEEDQEES